MNVNHTFFNKIVAFLFLTTACCFASCKDDEKTNEEENIYSSLTLNAGLPSDDGYEISKGQSWSSSDKIGVLNTISNCEVTALSYSGSSFSGLAHNLLSINSLAFFYPAEALTMAHSDTINQVVLLNKQDGTPSTLLNYRSAYKTSIALTNGSASASATMKAILAVADMKFTCEGAPLQDIRKLELRAADGTIYGKRSFNLRRQRFEGGSNTNIVIRNAQGLNGEAVLALLPTEYVQLQVTVFCGDGKVYVGTCENGSAIETGKHYDFMFDCHEENGKAHIGDYFYSDMTTSSTYNYDKTCIGIVFALSEVEGGPISKTLTESNHGRIVSLDNLNSMGKAWSSLQYDIQGMPNYSTIDGSQEEAFLPYWDKTSSSSYFENAKINATITEDGRIDTWPTTGLLSDFNGKENTAYADSSATIYGACGSAAQYAIEGIDRFYLPAGGELALLYELQRTGLISAATKQNFVDFEPRGYWIAAEQQHNRCWYIQFATGGVYTNYKYSYYQVRPLMHF